MRVRMKVRVRVMVRVRVRVRLRVRVRVRVGVNLPVKKGVHPPSNASVHTINGGCTFGSKPRLNFVAAIEKFPVLNQPIAKMAQVIASPVGSVTFSYQCRSFDRVSGDIGMLNG